MVAKIFRFAKELSKDRDGATAIEYGLIAALVAVIIIAGVTLLGSDIGNTFNNVANSLTQ